MILSAHLVEQRFRQNWNAGRLRGLRLKNSAPRALPKFSWRKMLGLERIELDGFLKGHGIYQDVTMEDIECDIADLRACLRTITVCA